MIFNIIYTPGTVAWLTPFLRSLLQHSSFEFRLVSNGCPLPERQLLEQLCRYEHRLSLYVLPTINVADHGVALNHLQAMTRERHFCFMDSDIFATGDISRTFVSALENWTALFSGAPLWATAEERILPRDFQIVSGVHHETSDGACLGSSYFAIYDNGILSDLMRRTGTGFEACRWTQLDRNVQSKLESRGWRKLGYDTGRVLNLMLCAGGHSSQFIDHPSLCHIGGFSFVRATEQDSSSSRYLHRVAKFFPDSVVGRVRNLSRQYAAYRSLPGLTSEERKAIVGRRLCRRDPVRRHFFDLLRSLMAGKPYPKPPLTGESVIDNGIIKATQDIISLYADTVAVTKDRKAA